MRKYTINDNGVEQVKTGLLRHHRRGEAIVIDMLRLEAWLQSAERSLEDSAEAYVEIRSWDSLSGRVELVNISIDGFDAVDYNEGE